MRFCDIPRLQAANYYIDVGWKEVKSSLKSYQDSEGLELDPDFQRGYVWSKEQKSAYLYWVLIGGVSGKDLFFNCTSWMRGQNTPVILVDGKQRLNAVMGFMNNEIPLPNGHYYKEYTDHLPIHARFKFHINDIESREKIIQWYIDMNYKGTFHTEKDISKAQLLLELERMGRYLGVETTPPPKDTWLDVVWSSNIPSLLEGKRERVEYGEAIYLGKNNWYKISDTVMHGNLPCANPIGWKHTKF